MDACRKIWFETPAQIAGQIATIVGTFLGIVAALAFL